MKYFGISNMENDDSQEKNNILYIGNEGYGEKGRGSREKPWFRLGWGI